MTDVEDMTDKHLENARLFHKKRRDWHDNRMADIKYEQKLRGTRRPRHVCCGCKCGCDDA